MDTWNYTVPLVYMHTVVLLLEAILLKAKYFKSLVKYCLFFLNLKCTLTEADNICKKSSSLELKIIVSHDSFHIKIFVVIF